MISYLKEQSFGEIIRNTFQLYFRNFFRIVSAYFLLIFPFQILFNIGTHGKIPALAIIGGLLVMVASFFGMAVVTLLVSDICLGNKPSLRRYFKRAFGTILWKLLGTNLLQTLILMIGFILLIVPGIIFTIWFMFAVSIVILEEQWAMNALKRSKSLGKGYYLRNFGILLVLLIISIIIGALLGGTIGAVILATIGEGAFAIFLDLIQTIFTPLGVCAVVLMYYDLRVRKEAYNNEVLAEELRR
jgi:hypothetical protein